MDNFMDRLSKRFNAGEIIQANGEAEARETDRLKKQVEEYDRILKEVRRLNLKTIEISEQVSQMAAASIEQIESFEAPQQMQQDTHSEEILGQLAAVKERLDELAIASQEFGQVQRAMAAKDSSEEIAAAVGQLPELRQLDAMQQQLNGLADVPSGVKELEQRLDGLADVSNEIRGVQQQLNGLADMSNEIRGVQQQLNGLADVPSGVKGLEQRLDRLADVSNEIRGLQQQFDDFASSPEDTGEMQRQLDDASLQLKKEISDASYRLEASLAQVEEELSQSRRSLDASLSQFQEELSQGRRSMDSSVQAIRMDLMNQADDGTKEKELLTSVQALMEKQEQAQAENAKQTKEMIASLRLFVEEVQKHIEDYVHKEDVKVYRNVQAVINQQLGDKARELGTRIDQVQTASTRTTGKGTTALVVLTMLLAGASLALQILKMLGLM